MPEIIFTPTNPVHADFYPKPASHFLPDWYKDLTPTINNKPRKIVNQNEAIFTIKKCMPVFDALTAGYIIPTPADFYVKQTNGLPEFIPPRYSTASITYHSSEQAPTFPKKMPHYPKFMNPFSIRTPEGYSCLFMPPANNPNSYFEVLSGVVDTDTYTENVNFPFVLLDPKFEGLVPAGIPMIQVIPFKREKWQSVIGSSEDALHAEQSKLKLTSYIWDAYKRLFRQPKEYR
jgi:hypothetical protein